MVDSWPTLQEVVADPLLTTVLARELVHEAVGAMVGVLVVVLAMLLVAVEVVVLAMLLVAVEVVVLKLVVAAELVVMKLVLKLWMSAIPCRMLVVGEAPAEEWAVPLTCRRRWQKKGKFVSDTSSKCSFEHIFKIDFVSGTA